jgi:hypothetical protein
MEDNAVDNRRMSRAAVTAISVTVLTPVSFFFLAMCFESFPFSVGFFGSLTAIVFSLGAVVSIMRSKGTKRGMMAATVSLIFGSGYLLFLIMVLGEICVCAACF